MGKLKTSLGRRKPSSLRGGPIRLRSWVVACADRAARKRMVFHLGMSGSWHPKKDYAEGYAR